MNHSDRVRRAWATRSRIAKNRTDLTGQTFGRLRVLSYIDTQDRRARWRCQCACGTTPTIAGKYLRNGAVKSCGCPNSELSRQRAITRNKSPNNPAMQRWANR